MLQATRVKFHNISARVLIALFICGCSRGYDVGFQFDKSKAVGTWVLDSAPGVALQALGTNAHLSRVVLKSDGTAEYCMLPCQVAIDMSAIKSTASQWRVVSGSNIWHFTNEHYGNQNVSTVMLETSEFGAQFNVGRSKSGDVILAYKRDAMSDDQPVIFRRVEEQRNP